MKLHKDKSEFIEYIRAAADYYGVNPALIEKDYYVTLFLSKVSEEIPGIVFKGGTSLSKCYKLIDRFSEDIDLTLDVEHFTQGQKRAANKAIAKVCADIGLVLINKDETLSRRNYNCFNVAYPITFASQVLKSELKVEMTFIQKSYPDETTHIASLIGEFLTLNGHDKIVTEYGLEGFKIKAQTPERTFIDKVFAVCDYMLRHQTERQSRHIYDIARLLTRIELNESLRDLASSVREERKKNKTCLSAQDGVCVPKLLRTIIETEYYRKDYEESTEKLLLKPLSYQEAVGALKLIMESDIFNFTH